MSPPIPYFGEILAIACAFVWSLAIILFKKSGEVVHPLALNLFKNVLAIVLLVPTLWLFGVSWPRGIPASDYGIILLSGMLGIGIADTLFFVVINRLGAGLYAIIDCLYSPAVITLAVLGLGERMSGWQLFGTLLIISAVFIATFEKPQGEVASKNLRGGIFYGVLAVLLVAVGIVIVKPVLERLPLLWVTELRLMGGSVVLLIVLVFHSGRKAVLQSLLSSHHRAYTFFGSFLGAYVSMILWLGGMKYTQASIAAALNQTSNVLIFLLAALLLREPITLKRSFGILLGVGGAYLVTFA